MKGRILVVDNENSICTLVAKLLKTNGYVCEEAFGLESAQEKLRAGEYDLLLTDKDMPPDGEDAGIELIRWVRCNKPKLPVFLMTGYPTVDTEINAWKAGALEFLSKPLDLKMLLEKINQALNPLNAVS